MNLNFGQSLQLQQKMSFNMIQSLKLLQVNTLQLEQMLKAELEVNPVLEVEEDMEIEADERLDDDAEREREEDEYLEELKGGEDNVDWDEYLEEGFDLGYSFNEEADPSAERYESSPVHEETLEEHLTKQLSEKKLRLSEREKLLLLFIIGSLDEDGYLRMSMEEVNEFTQTTFHEFEEALNVLWRFDPAGVGARDLRECMILQLRARGMRESLAMTIVDKHWDLFEKLRIPEISRRLCVSTHEVQDAIDTIKTLNPKPGYEYSLRANTAIIPDLLVGKVDGEFVVMLNDRSIPSLRVNEHYANLAKRGSKARKEEKEYIREKLNSANWFIKAIEQRRTTMLKVMNAIVKSQTVFFEKGPPNLKPLKMEEVAEMIEMSISTVSRVASSKYVQTQHGIFELKYFFTEAAGQLRGKLKTQTGSGADSESIHDADADSGETGDNGGADGLDVSVERIRNRIKQLIDEEDPKQPLTDQTIADTLKKENLPAARRTVAKYREQMKILPTRMRLKYD